jgi:hypothetical protein
MMEVMKFAHSRNAAERHLKKRHARGIVNVFRREARRGAIHHLAPGPETVLSVCSAVFGATSNHTLEGM